jgi:hypothetical protein
MQMYRITQNGLTIEDLAYDIIADLVVEKDGIRCAPLRDAFLRAGTEEEDVLLSVFDAVLFRRSTQSMSRLLAEQDRIGYLLLRSLRGNAGRYEDIVTMDRLDGRWYMLYSTGNARLHLPALPFEELNVHVSMRSAASRPLVLAVALDALELLQGQDEYRRALRETDIVQYTRKILSTGFNDELLEEQRLSGDHNGEAQLRADRNYQKIIEQLRMRLMENHVRKRNFSADEFDAFFEAASEYARDTVTGTAESQYYYLRQVMPGLTQSRFRETYRNRFSYFLKKFLEQLTRLRKQIHEEILD